MNILVIGAGFTGAVLANSLAASGHRVSVYDSRAHLAGNCHTHRDQETGIMVHTYGPHIFHTDDESVWRYVNRFGEFIPYVNRVKTTVKNEVYSLPINLHTINQFFGKSMNPREAKEFILGIGDQSITNPISLEEQALKFLGKELYEAFFKGYTKKQWGLDPAVLPASILKRLPVRFNYDDNYFSHKYQGMPKNGYADIVEKMLDEPKIDLVLNKKIKRQDASGYDHVFYSGPIDEWFDCRLGRLDYRTLDFEEMRAPGDIIGCAVMNFGDESIPFTRISEHKYFAPWENHAKTIAFKEFSRLCGEGDIPYYPIRQLKEKQLLQEYVSLAKTEKHVSFVGRLGTYRYLDMDVTIGEALFAAEEFNRLARLKQAIPAFFVNPL